MCLTIPKKVIAVDGENVTVETLTGHRQTVRNILELNPGDYCVTQQNIVVEKLSQEDAKQIIDILTT